MTTGKPTRLETQALPVDSLVEMVRGGRIRIPSFQRGLRWSKRDVQRLFDSIVHGYPIGNLLLWRRPASSDPDLRIGALHIRAESADQALFVVDGQQRLTSLASALSPEGLQSALFALAYDVRKRDFVNYSPYGSPFEVPLPTLFDLTALLDWFSSKPELGNNPDLLRAATEAAKAIREFRVPIYIVDSESPDVLRDIFDRMNNFGKQLTRAEVFSALHEVETGEKAEGNSVFAKIAEQVHSETGFGILDEDTVFLAFLARRGPEISRDIRREFTAPTSGASKGGPDVAFANESPAEAHERTAEALVLAITFLQQVGHIPHFALLPYRYLLVVLVRLFGYYPHIDPASSRNLRRWLWRAAVRGPEFFKGSSTGAVRTLSMKVSNQGLSESIAALLQAVSGPRPTTPQVKQFKTNYSATRLLLNMMWNSRPRRLTTQYAPFTESELLDALGESSSASDIAVQLFGAKTLDAEARALPGNRILLPTAGNLQVDDPNEELRIAATAALQGDAAAQDALATHHLDSKLAHLLANGQVLEFVLQRSTVMIRNLETYLELQAEWEFEDTAPLDTLLLDEDEDEEEDEAVEPRDDQLQLDIPTEKL